MHPKEMISRIKCLGETYDPQISSENSKYTFPARVFGKSSPWSVDGNPRPVAEGSGGIAGRRTGGPHLAPCYRSARVRVKDLPTAPLLCGHVHVEAVTAARADYVCASA